MRAIPSDTAYLLKQRLTVAERGFMEPLAQENYVRSALIFVDSRPSARMWTRDLHEYVGNARFFEHIRRVPWVSRSELAAKHNMSLLAHRIPIGRLSPLRVYSDVASKVVLYSAEDDLGPVPYDALYFPSVIPSLPGGSPEAGEEWEGFLEVCYDLADGREDPLASLEGATDEEEGEEKDHTCEFGLAYTARVRELIDRDPVIEITVQEKRSLYEGDYGFIGMLPAGAWNLRLSEADVLPITSEGWYHLRLYPATRDGAAARGEADLLDCSVKFDLRRVPVTFDEGRVFTAAWAVQIDGPDAFEMEEPRS